MAKHKEIETKWAADVVKRSVFLAKIKEHLALNKFKYEYLFAAGYDYYYRNPEGRAPRHRHGGSTNELTCKARIGKKGITVRKEVNLKLAPETSPHDVQAFMDLVGFKKVLPLYKICDIFFIQDGKASVDIVWYKTSRTKQPPQVFVEVEVANLPSVGKSRKLLKKWKKVMFDLYGLTDDEISEDSLYEIFSGKKYRRD